ncbi:N-acetylglucosamine-6-phosphate deacetylase, putative [Naematelia encephala]|uniref:N-acetylglucosamine-6-phosphate deacetylase n=1 Tax=Naematelia encephala TaxID=71784 RepID=A0A1Y2BHL6_9TREE|nr:N-acetylglucosamine-6-phosphate deacetylase, putative [Naematelia encephala]
MTDVIRFTNGYLAMPDGTAIKSDLYISQSTGVIISGQSNFYSSLLPPGRTIDLDGCLLSPGLIDVQINGAYGVDFSELDLASGSEGETKYIEGLEVVARRIVETGCTSFVPTIITQKEELYSKLLRLLAPRSAEGSAHVLGYHAEGPFLHPLRRGAHSQTLLMTASSNPPIDTVEKVYGAAGLDQQGVKLITMAPDVEGVMDCVENLSKRGVTVSIGHSDATLEVATEAVDKGARMITHLFNAMPPIHHRDPGVIGLLGDPRRKTYYGLIVDGLHSHPNTVRIAYGAARESCVLVTDAQSIMDPNLPDGVHDWRPGVKFRKEGHRVVIDGTNTLAGSNSPLPTCIQNLMHFTSIPLPEALLTCTLHPAELLNLGGKGQLKEGFEADLCVLDWEGRVRSTWVAGKEVWRDDRLGKGDRLG